MPTSSARRRPRGLEGRSEDRPVHASGGIEAELDHHAGEEQADRRRRDGVGVGEPEVERDDRALDEEPEHDEDERHDDQAVGAARGEGTTDRGQVQRAGARVEQGDARRGPSPHRRCW